MKKVSILICLSLLVMVLYAKDYKGAEIYSKSSWKYGKIEMRMMMAKGDGLLSTFFTYKNGSELSGAFWEEIDIEVFGKENAESFQSNIITNNPKEMSEEIHSPGYSMGDAYHTYTLEWTPNYVAWYIDGVEMRKTTGGQVADLTNSQSFRMNIWAAEWVDWVGTFSEASLPAYQFVNWISYSAYTPGEGDNGTDFTMDWKDEFDTFNSTRWATANWTFDGNLVDFSPQNVVVKDGYLVLAITESSETGYTGTVPTDVVNGITNLSSENKFTIYPNPATSKIIIDGADNLTEWKVFNIQGVQLQEGKGETLFIHELKKGAYIIQVGETSLLFMKQD